MYIGGPDVFKLKSMNKYVAVKFLPDAFQDARFANSSSGKYSLDLCFAHSLFPDRVSLREFMLTGLTRKGLQANSFTI